ncbi:hypothetical protein WN944_029067 [Citrus x changshan-huyou]|uniref:DDE Tnp4 domain-containing protein n=1 Tax=Citrus x changshan-huyou TaxID=2935761 RepID=A0AAP0QAR4_9ROSI
MGMHIPVMFHYVPGWLGRLSVRFASSKFSARETQYTVRSPKESTTLWITSTQICQASLPHIKVFPTAQTKFPAVIIDKMPKSYLINGIHHYGMPLIVFFGALKERFLILLSAPPYPLRTQVKLVVVACALHNYTRREKPDDWLFRMYEQDTLLPMAESLHPLQAEQPMLQANTRALQFCFQTEQLELACTEMCDDYISGLASL